MVGINMEMPNNCYDCYRNMYCIVGIDGGWRPDKRAKDCPLVEIGTCKDCRNASESQYNKCIYCSLIEHNCSEDFYCKEYKK